MEFSGCILSPAGMKRMIVLLSIWLGMQFLPAPEAVAAEQVVREIPFRLSSDFGDRKTSSFAVTAPGNIVLRVDWRGAANLALVLNGPGQTGYYVRKDGKSPLRAVYTVIRQDIQKRGHWTASIINFSRTNSASGSLRIEYPVQPSSGIRSTAQPDRFLARCVDKNRDVSVQVNMKRGIGTYYMKGNSVFRLKANYLSIRGAPANNLIELKGDGYRAFHLNMSRKILFFREGSRGEFCKLRIDRK